MGILGRSSAGGTGRGALRVRAVVFFCGAAVLGGGLAHLGAAGLDRAAERWLREVHLLILPDEEASFRSLATPEDRKQFQRIFWARRDPDPTTPKNEMEDAVALGRKRADDLFSSPTGGRGSETGCGQVFLLLGEPLEVEGRELKEQFNSLREMREGARRPEAWTYRSRPGDLALYTAGELRLSFDEECRFSEAGRVLDDLRRVARSRIVRPALDYRTTGDGRLVRLEDLRRDSTGSAHPPVDPGRRDFPIALEPKMLLRTQAGLGYAAGLFRVDLSGLGAGPSPTGSVEGVVFAEGVTATGAVAGKTERAFTAAPDQAAFVASYGVPLKPGPYTLRVGVRLAGGQASTASAPLEVPDFEASGLRSTPLILYPDEPNAPAAGPKDAFGAMKIGSLRLRPRFGDVFTTKDSLQVVAILFGGAKDGATGKANVRARFTLLKDGRPFAKGDEQAFDSATAVASIGPVPLTGYVPGRYGVRLEAKDTVEGTSVTDERSFEIKE